MAKYAPKHLEVSGGTEPHRAFAGHKTARLAVTAATTIAMTGSSLLAPFSAFANDLSDTTAQDAIMSPLAAHAGEAAGSAVKTNTQKIADLQAAIDAAKAAEASVVVGDKVKKGAKVLDDKGSVAVDKGSRALGKQLGKTRGMFKAFKDEYQKASGGSSKATK